MDASCTTVQLPTDLDNEENVLQQMVRRGWAQIGSKEATLNWTGAIVHPWNRAAGFSVYSGGGVNMAAEDWIRIPIQGTVLDSGGVHNWGPISIEDNHKGKGNIKSFHGTTLGKWLKVIHDGAVRMGPNGHARKWNGHAHGLLLFHNIRQRGHMRRKAT